MPKNYAKETRDSAKNQSGLCKFVRWQDKLGGTYTFLLFEAVRERTLRRLH
jgi:hypothetical protein